MVGHVGHSQLLAGQRQHPGHVGRDVAVADHDGALVREVEPEVPVVRMAVVPGHELGRGPAAGQVLAGDSHPPVGLGAHGIYHCVVAVGQLIMTHVATELDVAVEAELGMGRRLLVDPAHRLDVRMVRRHPAAHQSPWGRQAVVHVHLHAEIGVRLRLQQVARSIEAGRARAYDRDAQGILGCSGGSHSGMMLRMQRVAIVDMGSNSWRLVVYGYEPGTPWWSLVDEIREAVRIGAGMGDERLLRPERIDRAIHTAAVFDAFCRASGIDRIDAVATSAIRDARNGEELLGAIRARTGLDPRVISGQEEARYGFLAIANSTTLIDGFGLETGGGSIQTLRIDGRRLADAESLPLGSVSVSEEFLPREKATAKGMKALRKRVAGDLDALGWWTGGGRLVGIGGTMRNLAAAAMKRLDLPDLDVQGFVLTRDALEELIELLADRPASKRGGVPGIKPDRGDVILGGALVLAVAIEAGGFKELEVTEAGLREGIFFERLLGKGRLFDDVRRASVENLAHRFNSDLEHVTHVAELSLAIFDGLAAASLNHLGAEERELLWAACMLHDIGTAIDYDDHHRHSHYLILNAGLPGFSPREVVMIGLIARYHRKGDPDASQLGDLAQDGDAGRLRVLCGLIRLAEQLERSRDRSVKGVNVALTDGRIALEAETDPRADASVGIWAARRNADLLADALGREVQISA